MNSASLILREYWGQRHLIPKGGWLLLVAYSMVVFSSPMPPMITWVEILMGCGLLIGAILLAGSVIREARQNRSVKWYFILTALLLLVPMCVGMLRGNTGYDMVRDIFPLLFLLVIPILLSNFANPANRPMLRILMATALVFVGVGTAATFFVGVLNLAGSTDQILVMIRKGFGQIDAGQASQLEFNNRMRVIFLKLYDPAMLFASIFLSSWGVVLLVRSWRCCFPGIILAGMGVFIAYGFMILGLRAYTLFFVLAVMAVGMTKHRDRGLFIRLLPALLITCVLFWPQIMEVLQLLWAKQQAVGTNGKAGEWKAVISLVFSSPQTTLFGIGWGGTFNNPIVNDATRYTHSAISFYLLKSGLLGLTALLLCIIILFFHGRHLGDQWVLTSSRLISLASCLPPLVIGVLLEPTYKMLSFGVILALFLLSLPPFEKRSR